MFQGGESSRGFMIADALALFVVGVATQPQCPVVDIAATPEGTGKNTLLFVGWIKPILVGFLLLHALHCSIYRVGYQAVNMVQFTPIAEARGPLAPIR